MIGLLFVQAYKRKAKKVMQSIETLVRRKTSQFSIDSPRWTLTSLKRRAQTLVEINTIEDIRTQRRLFESPVQSPSLDLRTHHLGRSIEEEEEISSLPSIPNENDPIPDFEFSPRPKSLILEQIINQDKIHDTL